MISCKKYIGGFEFSREEIEEVSRRGGLLSMEIEFSQVCNFRCPYCYVPRRSSPEGELSPAEAKDAIRQAKELGARKIVVLGGEPMIYPHIEEMIDFCREQELETEVFTNGTNVTAEMAHFLFDRGVRVVLKMNTKDRALQNVLGGRDGAYEIIQNAFGNLRQAGYPGPGKVLGVGTVVLKQNADEMTELWDWLRGQGIEPYFEMLTPQGSVKDNEWLVADPMHVAEIFNRIAEVDRTKYGHEWDPQPPLLGNRCLRHQFSVLVNAYGQVFPCVGVTIEVGNVRHRKLRDIIRDSEVMQDLRNYRKMIKGPCGRCGKKEECYGCRGAAYQLTGDYLGSDPLCWRNHGKKTEIDRLPTEAAWLIPQKEPMRLVDTLVTVGERSATTRLTVPADSPFVGADGRLDAAAYLEIMAQSMAAANGFRLRGINGKTPEGFLLGAKNLVVRGKARPGDELTVRVYKEAKFGDFGIVRGRVSRNGDVLAEGEFKVFHKTVEQVERQG